MLRAITWSLVLCLPFPAALGQDPPAKEDKAKAIGKDLKFDGKLTADDPKDQVLQNSYHKVHTLKLEAGTTYVIDLKSFQFDSFLRLEDAKKKQLAQDDDGGGFPHARITYTPGRTDDYRIIVTTFKPGETGAYNLTIRQPSGVEKKLRGLEVELQKSQQGLEKEFRAARSDEDREKIRERYFELLAQHMEKVGNFAQENAGDPSAQEAQRTILQLAGSLGNSDSPGVGKSLQAAYGKTKQENLKNVIGLALGKNLQKQYEKAYQNKVKAAAGLEAEAEKVLSQVADNATGPLQQQVQNVLFDLKNLTVGKKAPDIEGEDLDGKKFKLSDYKGKVVSLVFWGSWCPPCRAMIPHERELVKKMQDRPFALIGVNSDKDKEALGQFREKEKITWRSFWNGAGGTGGPISQAYRVSAWPSIWVLDANGVIRYRHVRGEAMERAVESLLKEQDKSK